jgi:hypothetical protein
MDDRDGRAASDIAGVGTDMNMSMKMHIDTGMHTT